MQSNRSQKLAVTRRETGTSAVYETGHGVQLHTTDRGHDGMSVSSAATRTSGAPTADRTQRVHALREELSTYRVSRLIKRANDSDVATADMEAAEEAANHKSALIELIIAKEQCLALPQ